MTLTDSPSVGEKGKFMERVEEINGQLEKSAVALEEWEKGGEVRPLPAPAAPGKYCGE